MSGDGSARCTPPPKPNDKESKAGIKCPRKAENHSDGKKRKGRPLVPVLLGRTDIWRGEQKIQQVHKSGYGPEDNFYDGVKRSRQVFSINGQYINELV